MASRFWNRRRRLPRSGRLIFSLAFQGQDKVRGRFTASRQRRLIQSMSKSKYEHEENDVS